MVFVCDTAYCTCDFLTVPVIIHKLTVHIFCLCPLHLFAQQVYFPAFALLIFTMCIDLLEVTKSVSGLTVEFLRAVV